MGVSKCAEEAVYFYRLAAEQGDGNAQFKLGVCLRHGIGVEKDKVEGRRFLKLAADQGVV
jgi:TPR repeat protein